MKEPEIIAHDREQLAYLLTEAAEIEHGLMCCYLFAAFSLKRGTIDGLSEDEAAAVAGWRSTIIGVAIEEMLHLALVSNMLTAIGFAPQLGRQNFPVSAGYHPSGVVVSLAPFDFATLDHFVFLERPEGVDLPDGAGFEPPPPFERATRSDRLVPSSEDYATVGHLYRGIRQGFESLSAKLGERALFVGNPAAQVSADIATFDGLTIVTDIASAQKAIDTIVEQGEGTASHGENSHYQRFLTVREEYRALVKARPDFLPANPVAHNPVMRKPPNPVGRVHVEEPTAARLMDLGNALYGFTLRLLGRAFGQAEDSPAARQALFGAAIDLMKLMTPVAQMLGRMPASTSKADVHAGLSFTMARSNMGGQQGSVWPVLVERSRELATAYARAANDLDPSLGAIRDGLLGLAADLERASPVKKQAKLEAPKAAAPEVPTSTPAIEEARGKRLLLRFEGKRCIHSRHCVLGAPEVFRANVKGPWLNPDGIDVESLVAVAHDCPSGAITYERLDGGAEETAPSVNVLRVRENGPLAVYADVALEGHGKLFRATLCRCGASKNKPFCDNSHLAMKFVATGEPETIASTALEERNGVLAIKPTLNGPLAVTGNLEICSGTGRTVNRVTKTHLCRCGGSSKKPFCDGTHARIGFKSES